MASKQTVVEWLARIGLNQYAPLFLENDIGTEILRSLTNDDLKELGIASLGHRKKLLDAIAGLDATHAKEPAAGQEAATGSTGERRQLTVMFVDLVGSTALSRKLDPEEMQAVLQGYQNAVAGEISRLDGFTAKLMGDGVLAYFGWPKAHEDEAERAVRAGLAIVDAVAKLPMVAAEPLAARVGIATGLVVVGDIIGNGAAQEQAVVGDTPNLAARLQAAAEPGMVVIADTTRRLTGDLFLLRDLGRRMLKGINEPIPAYAVLGERVLESRFAARQVGRMGPIVGRDQELALLSERWQQAVAGEGQVILLTGEAGIGKSRIGEALFASIAAEPHFLVRYQCSPYHTDSALFPAIQQLSHAARFAPDDSTERRLDRLESLLGQATDKVHEVAPLIANLMGLDAEVRYGTSSLSPQQRRNRTLMALIDQLGGLAHRRPVMWVIEDAHWIDPTSLELIEMALDRVQSMRTLLLITARPIFVASFASHPVVTRLVLNRLSRATVQSIAERITGGKQLPELLLDEIATRTDGVPLFVEEMTKAIIESGVLREEADAFHLDGPLDSLAIPVTLHDSLMARLDRLQPVKELAQTAAVIGRSFDYRTIAALSEVPERELVNAMNQLVAAELIFRRGTPPDATYLFKHALVRDAAYGSMLKTRRTVLHAKLLEILDNDGDVAPEVMAQHAEAAGLTEKALNYWEQAGTQALARPAYKEAITSLTRAIELCRALGGDIALKRREQALQVQVGQALIANHGFSAPATLRAFEDALALANEIDDVALKLPATYGRWASHYIAGTSSFELVNQYVALAEMRPDSGPRVVGLRMMALQHFHAGQFKESLTFARKSLGLYDAGAHRHLANFFSHDAKTASASYEAWSLWHLGFPDQASEKMADTVNWAREMNHPNTRAFALGYGNTLMNIWLRRPRQVEQSAREVLDLSNELSMPLWRAFSQISLGWALSQQGTDSGIVEIEAGLSESQAIGARRASPLYYALASECHARAGNYAEASDRMSKAFECVRDMSDWVFAADLHRRNAALLQLTDPGKYDDALAELDKSLTIARGQESPMLELRAARDLARMWAAKGNRQEALALLAPIYGWFTEGFDTDDLKEAKALLDRLRK